MPETYEKIILPNGVRILLERIPHVRSVSAGIWIGVGSRNEKVKESGAAHFIEHMLFKGTETRSASDIAGLMDAIGGQTNAFTSKEHTCFYGRVLDEHLDVLLDVLCDMFFCSCFDDKDIISERSVILEEIGMYEDTPEDLVSERLFSAIYKGNSLGKPILGTEATLSKMDGEFLKNYMAKKYLPDRTVIALCGSFDDKNVNYLKERFSAMKPGSSVPFKPAEYKPDFTVKRKRIEQNHLCLAFPACSFLDKRRFAFQLFNGILGGGMSSRLFQKLREELGLCYSVFSFLAGHDDTGVLGVGTALAPEMERDAIKAAIEVLLELRENGVTEDELKRAREQVKANVIMGLESTGARMHRLGKSELSFGRVSSAEEVIESYNRVTREDVLRIARETIDLSAVSLSAVGRVLSLDDYREMLS